MYRQGDVLLIRVDVKIPKTTRVVPREGGKVVLAHGEVTFHSHAISERNCKLFEMPSGIAEFAGARILEVTGKSTLKHEEHSPIQLERGTYLVIRQREYSPEQIRNVAD